MANYSKPKFQLMQREGLKREAVLTEKEKKRRRRMNIRHNRRVEGKAWTNVEDDEPAVRGHFVTRKGKTYWRKETVRKVSK